MPGLIGFIRSNPPGGSEEFLNRMAVALESQPFYQKDLYHAPGIGLGRMGLQLRNPDSQPVWNEEKTLCVIMEGELYETAELRQELTGRGHRFTSDNDFELVLRLYREFGEEFAIRLNGAFALAIWEPIDRRLTIANDRLGLYPLYYSEVGDGILFSSGVRALLADPELSRKVDLAAINQFLVFDHVLDERTLLKNVHLLPQASLLTFQDRKLDIKPYWTLQYPESYKPQSESDYLEGLVHHLRKAVKRQHTGNESAGLLLSGGLDSRILLPLLHEASADKLHTFTFGIPNCDDARFAGEAAAKTGTRHHFFELKPDWLIHHCERAVELTDGLGNIINLHALSTLEEELPYAQILFKGLVGDAILGWAITRQMWGDYALEDPSKVHLEAYRMQSITFDLTEQEKIYTPSFRNEVGDAVYQSMKSGMIRSNVNQLANQRLYFDLTQRVPRMTIKGAEVLRSRCIVRLPFADNDFVDFALTVPPGFLFERHLSKAMMRRYFAELAKIPFTPYRLPIVSCMRDIIQQGKQIASWHLRKAGLSWLAERGPRSYKDYDNWLRGILREWMQDILLSPRSLERGYFNPEFVKNLVASHLAGNNYSAGLGALLTLELWHRKYID